MKLYFRNAIIPLKISKQIFDEKDIPFKRGDIIEFTHEAKRVLGDARLYDKVKIIDFRRSSTSYVTYQGPSNICAVVTFIGDKSQITRSFDLAWFKMPGDKYKKL